VTGVGIVLLVVGALVGVAEAHNPTHGILGGAGVLLMAIGAGLAVAGAGAGGLIALVVALGLAGAGAGALVLAVRPGLQARRLRVRTGAEGLIGHVGVVRSWSGSDGRVALEGGLWTARRSPAPDDEDASELHPGDRVVVVSLTGLELSVRPAESWELV
jgi:membrane-bound ClpP family serine protease